MVGSNLNISGLHIHCSSFSSQYVSLEEGQSINYQGNTAQVKHTNAYNIMTMTAWFGLALDLGLEVDLVLAMVRDAALASVLSSIH